MWTRKPHPITLTFRKTKHFVDGGPFFPHDPIISYFNQVRIWTAWLDGCTWLTQSKCKATYLTYTFFTTMCMIHIAKSMCKYISILILYNVFISVSHFYRYRFVIYRLAEIIVKNGMLLHVHQYSWTGIYFVTQWISLLLFSTSSIQPILPLPHVNANNYLVLGLYPYTYRRAIRTHAQ